MIDDSYETLLGDIYEAAWTPQHLTVVLDGLAQRLGADVAHLYLANHRQQQVPLSLGGGDAHRIEAANPAYMAYYGAIDPRGALSASMAPGEWLLCHEHFDAAYVSRSEFYQDYLIPHGLRYGMGTSLFRDGEQVALLGLLHEGRPFDRDRHLQVLQHLVPHLQRSLRLNRRLRELEWQAGAGLNFLEHIPQPALACADGGLVLHLNERAERLLKGDSLFRLQGQRLVCTQARTQQAFASRLRTVLALRNGTAQDVDAVAGTLLVRGASVAHQVSILPLPACAREHGAGEAWQAALVLFNRQDGVGCGLEAWLGQVYGCTPAEIRLARLLAEGLSPEDAAGRLGCRMPTVRTHISRLLEKTGMARMIDLVRFLLALPNSAG